MILSILKRSHILSLFYDLQDATVLLKFNLSIWAKVNVKEHLSLSPILKAASSSLRVVHFKVAVLKKCNCLCMHVRHPGWESLHLLSLTYICLLYDYFRERSGTWNPAIWLIPDTGNFLNKIKICQLWNKMVNNLRTTLLWNTCVGMLLGIS